MKLATSKLGQSELEITRVGIGTAPIGSNPSWSIYWGPQSENEAIQAIDAALDLGVNWIDSEAGWAADCQVVSLQNERENDEDPSILRRHHSLYGPGCYVQEDTKNY